MKKSSRLIGMSILSAVAASMCCIAPVLAILAGSSGLATTFSWLEPFRPYFLVIAILVLSIAWYRKLWPKKSSDCNCEISSQVNDNNRFRKFIQGKLFLAIVTVFVALTISFPYYSSIFFPKPPNHSELVDSSNVKTIVFRINGMTCTGCEEHVNHEVNKLPGIIKSETSYEKGNTTISFDYSKTNEDEIEDAINSTGYKVISKNTEHDSRNDYETQN